MDKIGIKIPDEHNYKKAEKILLDYTSSSTFEQIKYFEWTTSEIIDMLHMHFRAEEKKPKGKSIKDRKSDFSAALTPFYQDYNWEMMVEFFEYWAEHGENDKKMRFEKEKSFGIKRRLVTWKSRQKTTNKTTESKSDTANNWLKK